MSKNSSAGARAFQVLNNAGGEIAYIHKDGGASFPSLYLGPPISSRPDSNSEAVQLQPPGGNSKRTALTMDSYADEPASGNSIIGRRAQGTAGTPGATRTDDTVFLIGARGYQTTTNAFSTAPRASISMRAAENFTSTSQGMYLSFETTPVGGTTTAERLRITDSGNAGIMTPGKGIILKSPDGNCWLTTVANGGALKTSSIPCP